MTSYAMETRGTQHVRPRPRVRIVDDRRPQAHPARRQAPLARPPYPTAGAARGCAAARACPSMTMPPQQSQWHLTDRGIALVMAVFLLTTTAALVTLVTQFLLVTS